MIKTENELENKFSIFDMEIGEAPKAKQIKVLEVSSKKVGFSDGTSGDKVYFRCETEDGNEITISEVWNKFKKESKVQGLWIQLSNDKINPSSALGKFMTYHNLANLKEVVGKEMSAYPDPNGYLVFSTYNMD
jgi:hypothetical protein